MNVQNALTNGQYDLNAGNFASNLLSSGYSQALAAAQAENGEQNKYPLAVQQLLGQLAQGTARNTVTQAPTDWGAILQSAGSVAQGAVMLSGGG